MTSPIDSFGRHDALGEAPPETHPPAAQVRQGLADATMFGAAAGVVVGGIAGYLVSTVRGGSAFAPTALHDAGVGALIGGVVGGGYFAVHFSQSAK